MQDRFQMYITFHIQIVLLTRPLTFLSNGEIDAGRKVRQGYQYSRVFQNSVFVAFSAYRCSVRDVGHFEA